MPIPVISVAQMREWEKVTWASGAKQEDVMRQAGQAVAAAAEHLTRPGDFILVLAGKGHNGDDAVYASELLKDRSRELLRVVDPEVTSNSLPQLLDRGPALIVDGLFGIGLNRPLSGAWMKLLEQINQAERPVLSVDVPSGLSADTGLPLDVAIRARVTVTFGAVKQGLLKNTAAPFVGRIEVAREIGLVSYPFTTEVSLVASSDFRAFPPFRPIAGHKGTFGHLAIVAGSAGYHGAAVLAARGAQRAQPGLITLLTHEQVYQPAAAQLQAVMVHAFATEPFTPEGCTAVLVGPGLASADIGEPFQRWLRKLWQDSAQPVIVDATALAWLPPGPCSSHALRVITPHPGEAARMLGSTVAEVQQDRVGAARELSRQWSDCFVVLKGHHTVMLQGRGEVRVNGAGNPYLAQGGSGDLLAGYLGGLLAQPELQKDAARAIQYGVWQHAAAADSLLAAIPNFTVEDLAKHLGLAR
jgi:NAD(P)H-hydrate epimerase